MVISRSAFSYCCENRLKLSSENSCPCSLSDAHFSLASFHSSGSLGASLFLYFLSQYTSYLDCNSASLNLPVLSSKSEFPFPTSPVPSVGT